MKLEPDGFIGGKVAVALPERHCGRCQCAFPGDPTLFFQTDWALCPACEEILFSRRTVTPPTGRPNGSAVLTAEVITP